MSLVTLGLDLLFAYLIARTIERAWLRWLSAVATGLASVAVAVAIATTITAMQPGQMVLMFLIGAIWSPVLTAGATWWFRRQAADRPQVVQKNRNSYTQWHDQ